MTLINFTAKYDLYASQTDSSDEGDDSDLVAMTGVVVFTPVFYDERAVLAPDFSPRPSGIKLQPISGYLDADGQLKSGPGGVVGVRLPANDPVLELDRLVYQVAFNVRTLTGERVSVEGGFFYAPKIDVTVFLSEVLQSSAAFGAPHLVGGEFVGTTVIFENSDSTLLAPIDIPNGILVFVDNHDSTWSVG